MIKYFLLLAIGLVSGWLLHANFRPLDSVDLSLVQSVCPEFEISSKGPLELNLDSTINIKPPANCQVELSEESGTTPERSTIIDLILRGREITPTELTVFSHWSSFEDFDQYVGQFSYSNSELNRLLAKAQIFFHKNFARALEWLFSAKAAAGNEQEINTIQGEINALISFIRKGFFSLESPISDSHFVLVMEIANEKVPDYLPVILALIKHYILIGDYTLAEYYIDSIPREAKNQSMIELMTQKLAHTKDDKDEVQGGIPMRKRGSHFIVKVNVNNDISLNLLLDTGASRTAISMKTLEDMQRVSDDLVDLQMRRYVRTANGIATVKMYQAKTLEVSGFVLPNPLIFSANLGDDKEVQGLLGMDFLGKFQFRIDHEKGLLYLSH